MIRLPAFGASRAATVLVVLAALFHVQWLAACELMPMGRVATGCCDQASEDRGMTCDQQGGEHECVTPFAKGAAGIKLPERGSLPDGDGPDTPLAALSFTLGSTAPATGPPPLAVSVRDVNGRILYLASGRLRL